MKNEEIDLEIERKTTISLILAEDEVKLAVKDYALRKLKNLGTPLDDVTVEVALHSNTYGDFDYARIICTHVERT